MKKILAVLTSVILASLLFTACEEDELPVPDKSQMEEKTEQNAPFGDKTEESDDKNNDLGKTEDPGDNLSGENTKEPDGFVIELPIVPIS